MWKKLKARKIKKEIKGLQVEDTLEMGTNTDSGERKKSTQERKKRTQPQHMVLGS